MATASIQAELSLNTTAFAAAFGRVRSIIGGAGSKIAAMWPAVLGAGTAAFAGVAAGAYGVKKALDLGAELAALSAQTGLAAGELLTLQQAFTNNGIAAEDVGTSINKLQRTIVDGSDVFARMGVDLDALRGQSAHDQLTIVGKAIDGIADPAQRTAAAMEVFGKSGAKLLTLFSSSGAMELAATEVGTQAEILTRSVGLFDDVSNKLGLAGRKTQGFFVGVADKVVPVLAPLIDKFVALDLAKYGQAIGEGIAFIVQALADGKLGTILFTSAQIAFANAVNFLAGGLVGAAFGLGQMMAENAKSAVELFQIVTTAEFWQGAAQAWLGIAQGFHALLLDGVASLLEKLKSIPLIGEKIGNGAQSLRDGAQSLRERGAANRSEGADLLGPAMDRIGARMSATVESVASAAAAGFESGAQAIDTNGWQSQLDAAVGDVMASAEKAGEAARAAVADKPKTGEYLGDDEKKKATRGFADSDRRVGLGGGAFGGGTADPTARAIEKQSDKIDKTNALLQKLVAKESQTRIVPGRAVFT